MVYEVLFLSIVLAWLFAVGSTVGSFLNVVIYRLPAGMSLLFPSSHCPACKTPIRLRDNVPILGWLLLRGRCRDCGVHISARYPLVELATGLIFVVLAWFEPLSGDLNLPWVHLALRHLPSIGQQNLTTTQIWGIYSFHLLLFCSLLAAALIEYDGRSAPLRLMVVPLVIALVEPLIWPWLQPNSANFVNDGIATRIGATLTNEVWGLFLGALLAILINRATSHGAAGKTAPEFPLAVLLWVAIFLGERVAVPAALVTAVVYLVATWLARWIPRLADVPWSGWYSLVAFVWLIAWKRLDGLLPARTSFKHFLMLIAAVALVYVLSRAECKVRVRSFRGRCNA